VALHGDVVLVRSIYRGSVRWAFPHRYVGTCAGRHGLYCQPGSAGKRTRAADGASYLLEWIEDTPPRDWIWERAHVLRFMRPGDAHRVEVWWELDWRFARWYVNLQAPLTVRGARYDSTDWALDIVVDPDGAWQWKDEHELAEAVSLGIFDDNLAAEIRAEGERVIAARPWPTGWEDWRPPSEWTPLALPADWNRMESLPGQVPFRHRTTLE
jgi:hypothetical protein